MDLRQLQVIKLQEIMSITKGESATLGAAEQLYRDMFETKTVAACTDNDGNIERVRTYSSDNNQARFDQIQKARHNGLQHLAATLGVDYHVFIVARQEWEHRQWREDSYTDHVDYRLGFVRLICPNGNAVSVVFRDGSYCGEDTFEIAIMPPTPEDQHAWYSFQSDQVLGWVEYDALAEWVAVAEAWDGVTQVNRGLRWLRDGDDYDDDTEGGE
tara:strand:+ start:243 stop:884 length:642 start_codon:yes stop_codon:yes gene_type:complete